MVEKHLVIKITVFLTTQTVLVVLDINFLKGDRKQFMKPLLQLQLGRRYLFRRFLILPGLHINQGMITK